MPIFDEIKSSWADEVELESGSLPPPSEIIENGNKIVTEYKFNDDDKKVKVVRTYKISKQVVPRSVARRKTLMKFGDSANDKPGPNPHTTMVGEDTYMQFITNKEEEKSADNMLDPLKSIAKCRICNGEHWSVNCPFKGTLMDTGKLIDSKQPAASTQEATGSKTGKYVPPFMKDNQKGMPSMRGRDDTTAIRISNLSESMVESDLEELVKKFGPHSKMYLARDKNTGLCKGFAYVHFKQRRDAATAIEHLNGHGYDHLILNAEWSKPQNNN
ncbi:eukaryotic translation initiation factor 3 subunit G-1 [Lutzomyia longipalpis]|uniref:eukaryotic translation initiation factor 3 subunit G-1 n=1 Tax=Lutzomyia longipalpis TaxID=7200 RepID=UPI0024837194|nr:eukaryotic translation initiation factor 3 subunit G-1 [Lutzomyia longipalpis]XP_055679336.1 eukaryotic translation initiation factor 3 subunit G-1 [Lutzomyia longipalpis]